QKPEELEFIECREDSGQVIKSAEYRVKGSLSSKTERFFIEHYGMNKLKFECCGWEPEHGKLGHVKNKKLKRINPDYHMTISMYGSAEVYKPDTLYLEMDRNKIDYFYVTVQILEI
ncbi:MAG: DUF4952 domain-containing protein, partial [Bacteroidales bacterium]|nr:DUF4952 domain-containing protein [Bacteroidales bacterium]